MAVQTNYGDTMSAGRAGMIADQEPHRIISRTVTGAAMAFGTVAAQGAGDLDIIAPAADKTLFRGILVRDVSVPPDSPDAYPVGYTANLLTEGVIWVTAGAAVTAGQPAYFVPATGAITNVATDNVAIPNGIFDSSAASGALVKLRLS